MQSINEKTQDNEALKRFPNHLWRDVVVNTKEVSSGKKREARSGMRLIYGIHGSPFGKCLIGICEEAICHMSFFRTDPETHLEEFRKVWRNPRRTEEMTKRLPKYCGTCCFPREDGRQRYSFLEHGFSSRYGEKLMEVREGETLSYSELAESAGMPTCRKGRLKCRGGKSGCLSGALPPYYRKGRGSSRLPLGA